MKELQQAVEEFYKVYMPLRIKHYLKHRSVFNDEENSIEVYEAVPNQPRKRLFKVEADSQTEAYQQAVIELNRLKKRKKW